MNGLRQIMTPSGPILVSEEEAASLGLGAPPMPQEFGTPALAAPPETPVPDVAFQPPPANLAPAGGMPPIAPETASAPVLTPARPEFAPAAPAAETAPALASNTAPAQPPPQQPLNLSALSHGDIVQAQQANLGEQAAAQSRVGEKEAQSLEAQAAVMEQRNQALAEKEKADAEAAAKEQAAIAQKSKLWEAKNDEWMNAKVTRRGISTGELIGMAIAGLGSALKGQGGQNPAIPIVMAKIQQDVDDQIRERDELGKQASSLKGAVDYAREIASDAHAQRLAATGMVTQRYAREIETVGAKMAPGIKREQVLQQAAEMKGAGLQLVAQGKERQDQVDAHNAQLAQAERESRRQAASAAASRAQADRHFNATFEEGKRQFDATDKRARDLAMLDKQTELNKAIAAGDVEKAKQLAQQMKDERNLAVGGGAALKGGPAPVAAIKAMNALSETTGTKKVDLAQYAGFDESGRLLNRDGSVWLAPETDAKELRKQVSATITASNLIDSLLRERGSSGWSSDTMKSKAWREMQANKAAIIVQMKNAADLGALSGPDMELIESMLGTKDPTEWRDPSAGLQAAKKAMQLTTRNALTTAGYGGSAFNIPDASTEEKAQVDEDQSALGSKANYDPSALTIGGFTSGEGAKMSREGELAVQSLVSRAGVLRDDQGEINADAQRAVDILRKEAQSASNPAAKTAAAQALVGLALDGNPFVPDINEIKSYFGSKGKK